MSVILSEAYVSLQNATRCSSVCLFRSAKANSQGKTNDRWVDPGDQIFAKSKINLLFFSRFFFFFSLFRFSAKVHFKAKQKLEVMSFNSCAPVQAAINRSGPQDF